MGKGIALKFKTILKQISILKKQNKQIKEVAYLKINEKWIIYMIMKNKYVNKP